MLYHSGEGLRILRIVAAHAALLGLMAPHLKGETPAAERANGAGPASAPADWWSRLHVRNLRGEPLDPPARWYAVVFIGQECPVSNASIPVLNKLAAEFAPRGVAFVGAYVDPTASLDILRAHASEFAIGFPTADDRDHRLLRIAGATYTPEAAVFSAGGVKLYGGRIDDRVGENGAARPAAAHQDLRDVLAAIVAGAPGPFNGVPGYGCAVPEDASPPTWARDIAPILMNNCVECHRPGQVAPFSLLAYTDAAKRARFLAKTVKARIMPPWSPDGPAGAFVDERRLSDENIAMIGRWAEIGAPAGDLSQAPAPPRGRDGGWRLGPPDLVVRMRQPFPIPAGPDDTYEVFPIPFSMAGVPDAVLARARIPDTDVLAVAAVEIRAGNPRVLHHAGVFVDTTGVARKREAAEGGNGYASFGTPGFVPAAYLGGRVPGTTPRFLPEGIAAGVMPASGDIALQIHYHATGKAETDQSEVGIYFMRGPTSRMLDSLFLRSFKLDIPPGNAAYVVEDSLVVPADCILMSVFPHMHLLGREVHVSAQMPDGSVRSLIDISRWSFRWQDHYFYREPFVLPKGTWVRCRWVFDNSAANPSNPYSPPRKIRFGPNSTDEMCGLLLGVLPVNLGDVPLLLESRVRKMKESIAELSPEERSRFRWDDAFDDLAGGN